LRKKKNKSEKFLFFAQVIAITLAGGHIPVTSLNTERSWGRNFRKRRPRKDVIKLKPLSQMDGHKGSGSRPPVATILAGIY
jgi:hypothetical protein